MDRGERSRGERSRGVEIRFFFLRRTRILHLSSNRNPCYNKEDMILEQFINDTYHLALIEVVDLDYFRLYYGRVGEVWNEIPMLKEVEVQSINPFGAEVEQGVFEAAIQIVVISRLTQNIRCGTENTPCLQNPDAAERQE